MQTVACASLLLCWRDTNLITYSTSLWYTHIITHTHVHTRTHTLPPPPLSHSAISHPVKGSTWPLCHPPCPQGTEKPHLDHNQTYARMQTQTHIPHHTHTNTRACPWSDNRKQVTMGILAVQSLRGSTKTQPRWTRRGETHPGEASGFLLIVEQEFPFNHWL